MRHNVRIEKRADKNTLLSETARAAWADLTRMHPRDRTAADLSPAQQAAFAKAWSVDGDGIYRYNAYDAPLGGPNSNAFSPGYWFNKDPNHQVEKLFGRGTASWSKDGDLVFNDTYDLNFGGKNLPGVPTNADPDDVKIRSRISARALGLDPKQLWDTANSRIQKRWAALEPVMDKVYKDVQAGSYKGQVNLAIQEARGLQARYNRINSGPYKPETASTLATWKDPYRRNIEEFGKNMDQMPAARIHTGHGSGPATPPTPQVKSDAEKRAAFEIRDGDYASVKSVYDSLSNKEKNYVTPRRRVYKDLPKNLVSRSVAYDKGKPVAFTDIVGMFPRGTAAFETAVDSEHRGNGLSEKLSIDAFKKVLKRVKENREKKPEDREKWAKIKRFAWDVLDGNDASAHIAGKLKFKERRGHPDGWRSFVMSYGDAERLYGEKSAEYTPSEEELRRMYEVLQADARLDGKVSGLGFGRGGDAYRRAAAKLRVMELVKVLQDGKRIRNRIVHTPGYIPSEQDAQRAVGEYGEAERRLSEIARG